MCFMSFFQIDIFYVAPQRVIFRSSLPKTKPNTKNAPFSGGKGVTGFDERKGSIGAQQALYPVCSSCLLSGSLFVVMYLIRVCMYLIFVS